MAKNRTPLSYPGFRSQTWTTWTAPGSRPKFHSRAECLSPESLDIKSQKPYRGSRKSRRGSEKLHHGWRKLCRGSRKSRRGSRKLHRGWQKWRNYGNKTRTSTRLSKQITEGGSIRFEIPFGTPNDRKTEGSISATAHENCDSPRKLGKPIKKLVFTNSKELSVKIVKLLTDWRALILWLVENYTY